MIKFRFHRRAAAHAVAFIGAGVLASCASTMPPASPRPSETVSAERSETVSATAPTPAAGRAYRKVGKPYRVAGRTYRPADDPTYNQVGLASWYGPGFHGRLTANGEVFDMNAMSAAHPTLPLPSVVEVTNLSNGRALRLRLNDRGPFAKNRILDVSKAAARELGFISDGVAEVRVRYLGPADLSGGAILAEPLSAPSSPETMIAGAPVTASKAPPLAAERVAPAPASPPILAVADGEDLEDAGDAAPSTSPIMAANPAGPGAKPYFVQLIALSSLEAAEAELEGVDWIAPGLVEPTDDPERPLYRVRLGPFPNYATAADAAAQAEELGYEGVRLVPVGS